MLLGMGFDVEQGSPNGHPACVWVVDGERGEASSIDQFLDRDGGRRVVIVGPGSPDGKHSERVLRVGPRLNPLELRRALRAVAQACGTDEAEGADHADPAHVR